MPSGGDLGADNFAFVVAVAEVAAVHEAVASYNLIGSAPFPLLRSGGSEQSSDQGPINPHVLRGISSPVLRMRQAQAIRNIEIASASRLT